MHKKYQQLPSQFIPKHSHKYQLRKTLINTKFQWLMKYIHNEKDEADPKLSRIMKIQPKQTIPFAERKTIRQQMNCGNGKENSKQAEAEEQPSTKCLKNKQRQGRPSLNISKSKPDDQIFMDKQKLRNRCFSRNINRTKKVATFFEKENQSGSTTKLQRCRKLKTQPSLERSKTRNQIQARYQREPFVLSPWMFTEDNIENSQQFKF